MTLCIDVYNQRRKQLQTTVTATVTGIFIWIWKVLHTLDHPHRACFKKNSWLLISAEIFPSWLVRPKMPWKFSFHLSKILMTFFSRRQQIGLFFDFFHLVTPYSSLQISLSSLHIFVYHCTFCALLHVKTCPASASWRSLSCALGQRKCSKSFFCGGIYQWTNTWSELCTIEVLKRALSALESSWLKDVVSSGLYPSRQSWFNVSNIQKRNLNFILSISSPTESILWKYFNLKNAIFQNILLVLK